MAAHPLGAPILLLIGRLLQGFSAGGAAAFLIEHALPESTIKEWAWRIPFSIGLLIIPIGSYPQKTGVALELQPTSNS